MTAADGNEALGHLVSLLNRHGLAYMLVGAYSSNAYGIPRATKDADIVVAALDATFDLIGSSLGDGYQTESQLEFELITGTVRRKICFTPINFVLEIFQLSDDPFDQSRFKRRIEVQSSVLGGSIWLPTPEDVIIQNSLEPPARFNGCRERYDRPDGYSRLGLYLPLDGSAWHNEDSRQYSRRSVTG
ncbi:hypothetical protein SH139x_002876 [Planctomycetaceae bacterium SH139]